MDSDIEEDGGSDGDELHVLRKEEHGESREDDDEDDVGGMDVERSDVADKGHGKDAKVWLDATLVASYRWLIVLRSSFKKHCGFAV